MNELLKKSTKIVLDDSYYLESDGFNGLTLVYNYLAERIKKDGSKEEITKKQKYYYPSVSKTLNRYLELSLSECRDIKELKEAVEKVEKVINSIKEKWN